jgi:hypothetical protein
MPYFKVRDLPLGTVVTEPRGIVEEVFFPHIGVISLVVELKEGDMLETAMVGRDGAVGAASALDGKVSLNKAIVQIAGVASVLRTEKLREVARSDDTFRSLLIRTSRCSLRRHSSPPLAMPAILLRPGFADGCCKCATSQATT